MMIIHSHTFTQEYIKLLIMAELQNALLIQKIWYELHFCYMWVFKNVHYKIEL